MRSAVRAQGTVFAAQFVVALAFWSYSPLVDSIRREMLLTAAHIGLIPLVLDAAGLLAAPVGGWLTDRTRAANAYLVLVLGSAAGLLIMGTVPTYPLILLGIGLVGWQFATAGPLTNRMISISTPRRRYGVAYSIKQSSVALAMATWLFTAPVLASTLGWRTALIVLAGFVTIAGLAVTGVVARTYKVAAGAQTAPAHSSTGLLTSLRQVGAGSAMRWLFGIGFCFQGVQYAFMTFAIPLLVDVHGLAAATAAVALGATQAAAVVSRPMVGWLSDMAGSGSRLLFLAAIGATVGASLLGMANAGSSVAAVAWLLLGGAVGFSWIGIYFARLAELWPTAQLGFSTGVTLIPIKVGGMLIPALLGLAIDRLSYRTAFSAVGVLLLGGAALLALAHRTDRGYAPRRPSWT